MLAFLDLETTGLSIERDDILELACIVTDDAFAEVARYHAVIKATREFHTLPEVVRDMHTQSGLWREANGPTAEHLLSIDKDLAAFLREHAVKITPTGVERPQLAGNGIHFDRGFMRRCLRHAEAELHYRQLDITSVNELMRRCCPAIYAARPRSEQIAHRALADTLESLAIARYYANCLVEVRPQ